MPETGSSYQVGQIDGRFITILGGIVTMVGGEIKLHQPAQPLNNHAAHPSTGLTLPTSCSSISTIGYYDIDNSSSCTSSHASQSSPKGSIRKETWQTTPLNSKGFFGFTSRCTSRSSVYASTVFFSRSGNVGLYNTTTRRICPSHSSSTTDDPRLPTPSRTTTTTSSPRFTTNWPHSSDAITQPEAAYTTASTRREGQIHWTCSSWSQYYFFDSTSTHSTVVDTTIAKTPIQDSKITLPTIHYTFSSPTTSSSPCRPTSFSSSSTSILNQTSQRSPNTFPLPTTVTAKTTLTNRSSTSSVQSSASFQNSSSFSSRPWDYTTTSSTSFGSEFYSHTRCWWLLGRLDQQPLSNRPPSWLHPTQIPCETTTSWSTIKPTCTRNSTTWSRGFPSTWWWQRNFRCSRSIFNFTVWKNISKSTNLSRPLKIHIEYDAWQNWTLIIQYHFVLYSTSPPKSSSTISLMRCSLSWPSHTAPWTTTSFSSRPVKPLSWTSPELSHRQDYWI